MEAESIRQKIIHAVAEGLEKYPSVFAFWLEGADAHNRVDEYSDIDMWFDVKDGYEEETLIKIKNILTNLAPIHLEHEIEHQNVKIRQKFFHLEGTSEFLIIDVCVQSHSREIWFTNDNVDEKVHIIFDKEKVITFKDLDKNLSKIKNQKRINELEKTYLFFQLWTKKGIARGNFLEALEYYHTYVLEPLVELLRIHYEPTKQGFNLKHIQQDLPENILEKLEDLYKVNSLLEMSEKTQEATKLFFETIKKIESK